MRGLILQSKGKFPWQHNPFLLKVETWAMNVLGAERIENPLKKGEKTFAKVAALFPWSAMGRQEWRGMEWEQGKLYTHNEMINISYIIEKKFLLPKIYFLFFTFTIQNTFKAAIKDFFNK